MEQGVLINNKGRPIYWHSPRGRTIAYLPDSRTLWDIIWENRNQLWGFAHSHPGGGIPEPSFEDLTTFAAVESALGRRLFWPIISQDAVIICIWVGPGKLDYHIIIDIDWNIIELDDEIEFPECFVWLDKLYEDSYNI